MGPGPIIWTLWIGFLVSWLASAAWTARTEKRASAADERGYRIITVLAALLLVVPARGYPGRLWSITLAEAWTCAGLIAAGFAFCWWARLHLGRLWSSRVTRKAEHRVVATGPYGIVRHPIYTGILLAVYATAALMGTVLGLAGAALMTLGFWLKARLEERWLAQELPPGDYAAYRRKVPMLVPFGPKGR
jgi:protein-S-isoprenylcysteine O-methyltransferase Ste14